MGVGINTGLTSITGSVTATLTNGLATPTATQTPVTIYGNGSGADQTAYTVPAGKTLYIYTVGASLNATSLTNFKTHAAAIWFRMNTPNDGGTNSITSSIPLQTYTAGQNVIVNSNGAIYILVGVLV